MFLMISGHTFIFFAFFPNWTCAQMENQLDAERNQILDELQLFFQQDGASPHYAVNVCNWLNQ